MVEQPQQAKGVAADERVKKADAVKSSFREKEKKYKGNFNVQNGVHTICRFFFRPN